VAVAVLHSRALAGMQAHEVTVETHIGGGLPNFFVVGLPEAEVRESRDRVRAAIVNSQFEFPMRRVTVNLAPADLPKESGRFDLPIALGILAASGQIPADRFGDYEFAGELSLTGELRPVHGALAMTWFAHQSQRAFILPLASAAEAALVGEARILPARTLLEVCAHLTGRESLAPHSGERRVNGVEYPELSDVKGQAHAKRALEICAAGGHSLLMVGPPGTGKSMLAARFPGLLPPMSREDALESAAVQSLGSEGFRAERFGARAYRAPHHSASAVALVGGG
jgi:magnesium chelatase family protein